MTTSENLKYNEKTQDTESSEKNVGGFAVEIVNKQGNTKIVDGLKQLESAILHNSSVTAEQAIDIEKALDSMAVDFDGGKMSFERMQKIVKDNEEIWREIESGNLENHRKLTYITPRIAELLSKYQGNLYLEKLVSISDIVAGYLSKNPNSLYLNGLTYVSDVVAEQLSKHQGSLLLFGLTSLSDIAGQYLARHTGGVFIASNIYNSKIAPFKKPQL